MGGAFRPVDGSSHLLSSDPLFCAESESLLDAPLVAVTLDLVKRSILHICQASGLGAVIHESKLPLSDSFREYTSKFKANYLKTAIGVGEDYNLLLTLSETDFPALEKLMHAEGYQLFHVGEMIEDRRIILTDSKGHSESLQIGGWDHFKEKNL